MSYDSDSDYDSSISDSVSDYTHSSDSDYEPSSADDSEDDVPKHVFDMGDGVHVTFPNNKLFDVSGNVEEIKSNAIVAGRIVLFVSPFQQNVVKVYQRLASDQDRVYAVLVPPNSREYQQALRYGYRDKPLLMYVNEPNEAYHGPMTLPGLRAWINRIRQSHRKNSYLTKVRSMVNRFSGQKSSSGEDFFSASDVVVLDDQSIDDLNVPSLVMFFAPWCGHCQHAKPMYIEVAHTLAQSHIPCYALNCDQYGKKASAYGIQGYPTFALVNHKKVAEKYEGDRDTSDLVAWVKKNTSTSANATSSFFTEGNVIELDASSIGALTNAPVMFFAPWCGPCKAAKPIYEQVAAQVDTPCYALNCETHGAVAQAYGVRSFPTFAKIDHGSMVDTFQHKRTVEDLRAWIEGDSSNELELTPDRVSDLQKSTVPYVILFYSPHCGHCIHFKPTFCNVAKSHKNMYLVNCDTYPDLSEQFIDIQGDAFTIDGYPTTVKVEQNRVVGILSGDVSEKELRRWTKS